MALVQASIVNKDNIIILIIDRLLTTTLNSDLQHLESDFNEIKNGENVRKNMLGGEKTKN